MQIRRVKPGMVITHPTTERQVEILSTEMQGVEQVISYTETRRKYHKQWGVFPIVQLVNRCERCEGASNYDPTHSPSKRCRTGGNKTHCTCSACF